MKKIHQKDLRNFIDPAGSFQIIDLKEYELQAYIIKPRKDNPKQPYWHKKHHRKKKKY